MFIKEKFGFSLLFASGLKLEVDFGPMSESNNKTVSKREFEHSPKGTNAELRLFNKNGERVANEAGQTVEEMVDLCNRVVLLYDGD